MRSRRVLCERNLNLYYINIQIMLLSPCSRRDTKGKKASMKEKTSTTSGFTREWRIH